MRLGTLLVCGACLCGCSRGPSAEAANVDRESVTLASLDPVAAAPGTTDRQADSRLYPADFGDKYGYIDASGKTVIEPKFDLAWEFREGLAAVQIDWRPGIPRYDFIDESGKVVLKDVAIPLGYEDGFSEGLVPFEEKDKVGFMNRTGKVVISPRFHCVVDKGDCGCACEAGPVAPFKNGFAFVMEGHEHFYIDKAGKRKFGRTFGPRSGNFSEGVSSVQIGDSFGYIDTAGKVILKAEYGWAGDFKEGVAAVGVARDERFPPMFKYIDKTGEQAIPGEFTEAGPFNEGYAFVRKGGYDDGAFVIDHKGTLKAIEDGALPTNGAQFQFGLLRATITTDKTRLEGNSTHRWSDSQEVFVNTEGKIVMRFEPSDMSRDLYGQRIESEFDGKVAYIYSQDKSGVTGYVDRTGRFVWKRLGP